MNGVHVFLAEMEERIKGIFSLPLGLVFVLIRLLIVTIVTHISPKLLFNADETLMTVNSSGEVKFVRMLDSVRKAHQSKSIRLSTIGSMTPFVNAAGEVYLIVYCLKAPEGKAVSFNVAIERELKSRQVFSHAHLLSSPSFSLPSFFSLFLFFSPFSFSFSIHFFSHISCLIAH